MNAKQIIVLRVLRAVEPINATCATMADAEAAQPAVEPRVVEYDPITGKLKHGASRHYKL